MAAGELLVLWDVDNTLVNAGGLSTHLYGVVFAGLFGRGLPAVAPMAGRTDRAIIVETLTMAGIDDPGRHVAAFIDGLAREAPAFGERVRHRGRVLPGAAEALAALDGPARGTVRQSVLTGNIRPLAEVKLGALGLRDHLDLDIGAYGDTHEVRAELVHVARERAARAAGREFGGGSTVLVGDTPLDVAAARATRARAVAVATGSYSEADLAAAGADVVLPDLSHTPRVVAAVTGRSGAEGAGCLPRVRERPGERVADRAEPEGGGYLHDPEDRQPDAQDHGQAVQGQAWIGQNDDPGHQAEQAHGHGPAPVRHPAMGQGREDLDRAVDDPVDAEQQHQREQGKQHVPDGVQPDDDGQHAEQGQQDPCAPAGLVDGERRDEPEDPEHDELDAEQHGHDE
jgi:phosphoglycolate phosphatase